jgi:hypothetical protein
VQVDKFQQVSGSKKHFNAFGQLLVWTYNSCTKIALKQYRWQITLTLWHMVSLNFSISSYSFLDIKFSAKDRNHTLAASSGLIFTGGYTSEISITYIKEMAKNENRTVNNENQNKLRYAQYLMTEVSRLRGRGIDRDASAVLVHN